MILELIFFVILIAFILQFFDASTGMGYGTLTPLLLLFGFAPLEVISAVLFTSAILSIFTGFLHHNFDNINFFISKNIKILLILITFGIVAISIGVFITLHISEVLLKSYIGLLIMIIGIYIIIPHKKHTFSFKRLISFGFLASFNKGMTGGGYGPVLSGGQIISGLKSKHAVGITALSEGIISLFGFLIYFLVNGMEHTNWSLILYLLVGGLLSTPLAAYVVTKFHHKKLEYFIAIISIFLGLIILLELVF